MELTLDPRCQSKYTIAASGWSSLRSPPTLFSYMSIQTHHTQDALAQVPGLKHSSVPGIWAALPIDRPRGQHLPILQA